MRYPVLWEPRAEFAICSFSGQKGLLLLAECVFCTLRLFNKAFLVLFNYFIDITNTYLGSNFSPKMNTYSLLLVLIELELLHAAGTE